MKGSPKIIQLLDLSLGFQARHSKLRDINWLLRWIRLYRTKLDRMIATGPSKMEEIILNMKAECNWKGTIHWFGKMERHFVLSSEKWNEQGGNKSVGWRTKRVRGRPSAD